MLIELKDNRVRRAYKASGLINGYSGYAPDNYPEDWIASCVTAFNPGYEPVENEGLSLTADGRFLADILKNDPSLKGTENGILVKFLDSGERLVLQCHPTDEQAQKYFDAPCGKTECWYIVDTLPGACVYIGFKPNITREAWIDAFEKQDTEKMLSFMHRFNVKKGDVIFVRGGMTHAIGAGCFMVELQQPSDLMVIPERKTPSGRILDEMKLHGGLGFDKMFDCFEYTGMTEKEVYEKCFRHADTENGISCVVGSELTDKFSMYVLSCDDSFRLEAVGKYAVIAVLDGDGEISDGTNTFKVHRGSKFFVSANTELLFKNRITACVCRP